MNDEVLHSKTNNFLAAIHFGRKQLGIAFLDVSTGEFLTAQGNEEYIDKLLQNFNPSEILIPKQNKNQFKHGIFGLQVSALRHFHNSYFGYNVHNADEQSAEERYLKAV